MIGEPADESMGLKMSKEMVGWYHQWHHSGKIGHDDEKSIGFLDSGPPSSIDIDGLVLYWPLLAFKVSHSGETMYSQFSCLMSHACLFVSCHIRRQPPNRSHFFVSTKAPNWLLVRTTPSQSFLPPKGVLKVSNPPLPAAEVSLRSHHCTRQRASGSQ